MDEPFKSLVFTPLPEKPTPRDWDYIDMTMHMLSAYTYAAIKADAQINLLITALAKKGVLKEEDLPTDEEAQAIEDSARDKYVENLQVIERFRSWLDQTQSPKSERKGGPWHIDSLDAIV